MGDAAHGGPDHNPAVRETIKALAAQHQQDAAAARQLQYDQVAADLQRIWDAEAEGPHPYLARKGIDRADGVRVAAPGTTLSVQRKIDGALVDINVAGRLLVPLRNMDGQLRSLQVIDNKGQKMFARGDEVFGSHMMLGDINSPWPLHFVEGYATGKAVHDATGHDVVVEFSANNLAPVTTAYRERFPDRTLIIDVDNDHQKARERDAQGRLKPNTGKERAEAAARLADAHVALPPFAETDTGEDWDDYTRPHGKDGRVLELPAQIASPAERSSARTETPGGLTNTPGRRALWSYHAPAMPTNVVATSNGPGDRKLGMFALSTMGAAMFEFFDRQRHPGVVAPSAHSIRPPSRFPQEQPLWMGSGLCDLTMWVELQLAIYVKLP